MAYNKTNDKRNNSSMRSRKSSPAPQTAIADINDEMRVQMARDLCKQLNNALSVANF